MTMFLARTLSGRLLLLTVIIVMVTEVLVFLPSVARFREDYLMQRMQMAQIAALALLAAGDDALEAALEEELLSKAEVTSIVLRRDASRQLILQVPAGVMVDQTYDLRSASPIDLIADALSAMLWSAPRTIRVIGAPMGGGDIEVTLDETPLRRAMLGYAQRILLISLFISTTAGVLVFFVCRYLIVRPIERVVENMVAFQKNPEHAPAIATLRSGLVEIARAETALTEMQTELRGALRQKSRLADLGGAVAKISHDLRNMLASAQLLADRLSGSRDPVVARIGPKLIGSLDRATAFCVSTLRHGRAEEAPPAPRETDLRRLIEDVGDAVFMGAGDVAFVNSAPEALVARVDPDHLFRILSNLARNARQAIEATNGAGRVEISVRRGAAASIEFTVADDGPGLPPKALENLFQPFRGGARQGGSGLGLAIAAELATLNRGKVELEESTVAGARFRVTLPG
ncbi:MAG: HAMP domain-containing sensor histidine kinase [Paracoccaceae bacterium]